MRSTSHWGFFLAQGMHGCIIYNLFVFFRLESNQWGLGKILWGNSCKCPVHCRIDLIRNCCKTQTRFRLVCFHPIHKFYIEFKYCRWVFETNRLDKPRTWPPQERQIFQLHTIHKVYTLLLRYTCLLRNLRTMLAQQSLCTYL